MIEFITSVLTFSDPTTLVVVFGVTVLAGVVKGVVGFAMPMIMISGLSAVLAPDLALAALLLPTLATNGQQALAQGWSAAWATMRRFALFLIVGLVMLVLSAQLVVRLPPQVMFVLIGALVVLFAALLIAGWKPRLARPIPLVEAAVGGFAGLVGGMSGVWGPPTVAYLTAIDTPRDDQMRVQGVVYFLGAVALTLAHLHSGILNAQTWPLSAALIVPAYVGMWVGLRLQNRLDQAAFRKATLWVLLLTGLNLLRRGLV